MKYYFCLVTLWIGQFLQFPPQATPYFLYGTCIRIIDGDTFELKASNKKVRIRLAYIDAPEKKQYWGSEAKQFFQQEIQGKKVAVRVIGVGFYGRKLGEVIWQGHSINLRALRLGHVGLYPHAKFRSYEQKWEYLTAYYHASHRRVGMWARGKLLSPSFYRKSERKLMGAH